MIMSNFIYKMCSERITPFTLSIYPNIRCLYSLTILFQENINMEQVQLRAGLQGDCPPPSFIQWVGKSFSLPADLLIALH